MFAPAFHPAMKFVQPVRREIGVRTLFNVLGPLTNPAGVRRQLIGVSDRRVAGALADVMGMLGAERVLFVSAHDGLDEISVCGPTDVVEFDLDRAKTVAHTIQPEDFGLDACTRESILGGDVGENVRITRAVLDGEHGAPRTVTLMNAGAAIYAAGVSASIGEGIERATESIDSGRARTVLDRTVALTQGIVAA
jgi:anthranilate phosphoribosyltransferase